MYKNILVPFDFSAGSFHALEYAAKFKETWNSRITLIHVFPWTLRELINFYADTLNIAELDKNLEELRNKAQDKLSRVVSTFQDSGIKVHAIFREGIPYLEVLKESESGYDLIIIGVSHKKTGFGITPWKVTRKSRIPCLVVKQSRKKVKFSRILFPTDFSQYSKKAFEDAKKLADSFGSEIVVLNVAELYPAVAGETEVPFSIGDVKVLKKSILGRLMSEFNFEKASFAVLEGMDAGTEISEYARRGKFDLIVMPTHGRTGFERAFMGSVTEKVLKLSRTPVLILKGFKK